MREAFGVKSIIFLLIVLLAVLQYQLWFADGGVVHAWQLKEALHQQQLENQRLVARNEALRAEVEDLKSGRSAIEERARSELGMVKQDEEFYQVTGDK